MFTRTGEKSYQCGECEKEFVDVSSMNQHRKRTHAGQKLSQSYDCLKCGKHFKKLSLNAHRINEHQEYLFEVKRFGWEYCGKVFSERIYINNTSKFTLGGNLPFVMSVVKHFQHLTKFIQQ